MRILIKNKKKICKLCGKEFPSCFNFALYCSKKCNAKSWYRKKIEWISPKEVNCIVCKKLFIPDIYHPHVKTCSKICSRKKYFLSHREIIVEKIKEWRENNPEKCAKYVKTCRLKKPDFYSFMDRNRAHLRRTAELEGNFTLDQWNQMVSRQTGMCYWCGQFAKLTMDHVIPISKGGKHEVGNIVGACLSCNSKKNVKLWDMSKGRLIGLFT